MDITDRTLQRKILCRSLKFFWWLKTDVMARPGESLWRHCCPIQFGTVHVFYVSVLITFGSCHRYSFFFFLIWLYTQSFLPLFISIIPTAGWVRGSFLLLQCLWSPVTFVCCVLYARIPIQFFLRVPVDNVCVLPVRAADQLWKPFRSQKQVPVACQRPCDWGGGNFLRRV